MTGYEYTLNFCNMKLCQFLVWELKYVNHSISCEIIWNFLSGWVVAVHCQLDGTLSLEDCSRPRHVLDPFLGVYGRPVGCGTALSRLPLPVLYWGPIFRFRGTMMGIFSSALLWWCSNSYWITYKTVALDMITLNSNLFATNVKT